MKKKLLGILVCTLFLFSAFASATTVNDCRIKNNLTPNIMKETMGNVQISSDSSDEKHPSIAQAADGSILIAYDRQQSSLLAHIHIMRSDDGGNTWSKIWDTNRGDTQFGYHNWPVMVAPPGGDQVYAGWNDESNNFIWHINISDPSDPDTYSEQTWTYDASGWDSDRHSFTIAALDETKFAIGHVGHVEFAGFDLPSNCQIQCFTEGYTTFGITGDEDYPLGYNNEVAVSPNLFWQIWDFPNDDTGTSDLLLKWGDYIEQTDAHLWPDEEITSSADYIDPALAASGENIFFAYMSNENGDFDLKCRYSPDEGETWQENTIPSQSGVDEKSPEIYMSGSNIYCTFVRNNNLYLTTSANFGQTWDETEQINDVDGTVLDEPGAVDISSGGIAWVDTRNGNEDIYYYGFGATPIITVKSISGGFGVSAIIENTGNADAINVQWSIDLEGALVIVGNHADGTISTLAAGTSQTVKIGFVLGFGGVTIKAAADGATKSATGTVLLFLVTNVE